jgi:hypothetical protein
MKENFPRDDSDAARSGVSRMNWIIGKLYIMSHNKL